jgi:hypothetical protein
MYIPALSGCFNLTRRIRMTVPQHLTAASRGVARTVSTELEKGEMVEIKCSLWSDFQRVASVQASGSEWVQVILHAMPDMRYAIPVSSIDGFRFRRPDE